MAISRSLSIGSSSLKAHQLKFDIISNNLANLNTIGYKGNRANFEEQFSQLTNQGRSPESVDGIGTGGTNPVAYGLGVKLGSVTQDMSQGTIETTNRPLDMAIQGEGFFMFNLNGQEVYSRAGNISRDRNGYMVDTATGAILQGYSVQKNSDGKTVKINGVNSLASTTGSLNVPNNITSAPKQTENLKMTGNLNTNNEDGTEKVTSINIYDKVGGMHELKLSFVYSEGDPDVATDNGYALTAQLDGNSITLNNDTPSPVSAIAFNNDGTLKDPFTISILKADLETLVPGRFDSDIKLQLADPEQLTSGITNYAASNTVTFTEQDGYKEGDLIDLSIDNKGQIWGSFTNGKSERLGQVALAKFSNNEGLIRTGGNFYRESPNSGIHEVGSAVDIFPSTQIAGGSLEQSNVDMTIQFTDLISTQRAYEAAARTITLSDQILQETTNLKR